MQVFEERLTGTCSEGVCFTSGDTSEGGPGNSNRVASMTELVRLAMGNLEVVSSNLTRSSIFLSLPTWSEHRHMISSSYFDYYECIRASCAKPQAPIAQHYEFGPRDGINGISRMGQVDDVTEISSSLCTL